MENINSLKKTIAELIKKHNFIKIKLCFGKVINKNILKNTINKKNYLIFLSFLKNKNKNKIIYNNIKKYYYNDLIYIIKNNNNYCLKSMPTNYYNYKVKNINNNVSNICLKIINERHIQKINFPSINKYNRIDDLNTTEIISKYKNSEIKLIFYNTKQIYNIYYYAEIDSVNFNNFVINLEYLLSKFYFKQIKLL